MIMRSLGLFASLLILITSSNSWAVHTVAPGETDAEISDFTADDPGEGPFPPFSELDRNGDGGLDPEEVSHIDDLNRQFEAADINQDGSLDEEEFSAFEVTEGVMPGLNGVE